MPGIPLDRHLESMMHKNEGLSKLKGQDGVNQLKERTATAATREKEHEIGVGARDGNPEYSIKTCTVYLRAKS
jgi:hypothetical protein